MGVGGGDGVAPGRLKTDYGMDLGYKVHHRVHLCLLILMMWSDLDYWAQTWSCPSFTDNKRPLKRSHCRHGFALYDVWCKVWIKNAELAVMVVSSASENSSSLCLYLYLYL